MDQEKYPASGDATPTNSVLEQGALEDNKPAEFKPRAITGVKWALFIISTLTSIWLYALDNTVVANIQPAIVNAFDAIDQLPWLSVGFMIGGVSLVMPLGKLYALYDGKWIFIIGFVVFMAASALCGGAPNMTAEIIGRVFAGAGGNAMYLGLLNLISVNTTDQERPAYLSLTGLVWGLGTVLGPVIGGAFELYTWRWAFYVNLLFIVFLLPAYIFLIPSSAPPGGAGKPILERARTIDWLGAFLSIAGFVLLIVPINFGGTLYAWDSGAIIAMFVVGGVVWILFGLQQSYCILTSRDHRMFPVHLVKNKEVVLLFVIGCCVGTISYVSVYYIPLYFQFTRGDTAIKTAERMLPFIVFLITFILASGYLMGKFGYYKPWFTVGSALALVGAVLYSQAGVHTSNAANYGYQILLGVGAGAYTQATFAVVQAVLPPEEAGNGITLMLVAQLSGLAFGLSVAGALFINFSEKGLAAALPSIPRNQVAQIVAGTSGAVIKTLSEADRETALEVIVAAEGKVFTQIYVAAAVSLVLSLFLSNRRAFLPTTAAGG